MRASFMRELQPLLDDRSVVTRVGHGRPQALIDAVLACAKRFFALPQSDKLAIEMVCPPQMRG